jgi:hypothetical protein
MIRSFPLAEDPDREEEEVVLKVKVNLVAVFELKYNWGS